jgi:hypothetical protein
MEKKRDTERDNERPDPDDGEEDLSFDSAEDAILALACAALRAPEEFTAERFWQVLEVGGVADELRAQARIAIKEEDDDEEEDEDADEEDDGEDDGDEEDEEDDDDDDEDDDSDDNE